MAFGNSLDCAILPVGPDERACSSFEGCSVPMYECVFTMFEMHMPFYDFEVVKMNRLKVSPLQLHPGAWAFMVAF